MKTSLADLQEVVLIFFCGHSNIMPCILKANCALQPQKIAEKCVNLVNNILFQKCVNSQNPEKGIFHCEYMNTVYICIF